MNQINLTKTKFLLLALCLGLTLLLNSPVRAGEPPISEEEAIAIAMGEVGPNDFRIGETGDPAGFGSAYPDVVYNSARQEYYVVWERRVWPAVDSNGGDSHEIFGQRVAAAGERLGPATRLSYFTNGSDYRATTPAVAWNSAADQYLVVWSGVTVRHGSTEDGIFGQRVAGDGSPVGDNDFRISTIGTGGVGRGYEPDVVYASQGDHYLVVWEGHDYVNGYTEIYAQLLQADGAKIGPSDLRISFMEPAGQGWKPAVAYNAQVNQFLIVWQRYSSTAADEIYGQRLYYTNTKTVIGWAGVNFVVGQTEQDAGNPALAYNTGTNQYLVVWRGSDNSGQEKEIYGRLLDTNGTGIGDVAGFRISSMGPDGDARYIAETPSVVYNPNDNQYLVVWRGNDRLDGENHRELEVYGRRLQANGAPVDSDDLHLSDMGPAGDRDYAAHAPAAAYNPAANQYLVAWYGDDDRETGDGEFFIFGQRVDAATGAETGADDLRINDFWTDDIFDAEQPVAAYNPQVGEYLVAWIGHVGYGGRGYIHIQRIEASSGQRLGKSRVISQREGGPFDSLKVLWDLDLVYNPDRDEYLVIWSSYGTRRVYGQLLDGTGQELKRGSFENDFVIKSNANLNDIEVAVSYDSLNQNYLVVYTYNRDRLLQGLIFDAISGQTNHIIDFGLAEGIDDPAAAYNNRNNQFFVIWSGYGQNGGQEIYGRRIAATTGAFLDTEARRLSQMGPENSIDYYAVEPDVVYNPDRNEYLVVWSGSDDHAPLVLNEFEIFGQRLDALTGQEVGQDDVRLSEVGIPGDPSFGARTPRVAYDSRNRRYLVAWVGGDTPLAYDEWEVYGQMLDETGNEIGQDDVRLSDMGPDGNVDYDALGKPELVFDPQHDRFLLVWAGNDDSEQLLEDEFEIFGQFYTNGSNSDPNPDPNPGEGVTVFLPLVVK